MGKLISKYFHRVKCSKCKLRMKRTMSFYDKRTRKYYCATCVPSELFRTSIYGVENYYQTENAAVGLLPERQSI